ncbi:aspartate/glutamate/uridylate kinase [Candidatus Nitrosoglobus terrae]|uniref:Aspartate/glutamate/uridylate kinase n=1 Tax=Candidatus Nitrosoglobus terrae TaxID=1630141 RepID=A0A1Q2SPT2_9GAMM|nr:amino acid kinase [Candidatus Nitrosoglobus terrae]BAW81132.1 aspartate/glutamate/uridylate kinase [Candidatus Nitrosoglobus terrae]
MASFTEHSAPWVIKLGGSLYYSHTLSQWLQQLSAIGAGKFVIVPGGGPFADQVRAAQKRWKITNIHAHAMALLAMGQFGYLLQSLAPKLCVANSCSHIHQALHQGQVPIWLPTTEVLNHPEIPATWEVTSDSLALWLSGQLKASRLILVKSAHIPDSSSISAQTLAQQGIVDTAFPNFLRTITIPCYYAHTEDYLHATENGISHIGTCILV